jgi:RimJ/RimL family protein N-acetyltransferase
LTGLRQTTCPAGERKAVKNPFLIGTKVYLRPLGREDAPLVVPWVNDAEVTRTLLLHRPMTLKVEEDYIDKMGQSEHDVCFVIAERPSDRPVGLTSLHQIDFKDRHASFGIMIGAKGDWGKGYGTEATALVVGYAFETLNLNRVWLHVREDHERGIRAYEKAGFRKEGVLRQQMYREGRYWDLVAMGILREDWAAGRRPPE